MVQKGRREFPLISDHFLLFPRAFSLLCLFIPWFAAFPVFHEFATEKTVDFVYCVLCVTDEKFRLVSDAKI